MYIHKIHLSEKLSTITFTLTTSVNSLRNLMKFQYHFHLNYNVIVEKR